MVQTQRKRTFPSIYKFANHYGKEKLKNIAKLNPKVAPIDGYS